MSRRDPSEESHSPDHFSGRVFAFFERTFPAGSWRAFVFAVACVALATGLRMAAGALLGVTLVFASYYPAVMVSTLLGGAAAGAFATALSLVAAWWIIVAPAFAFGPPQVPDFLFFLLNAGLIVCLAEGYRRKMRETSVLAKDRQRLVRELEHRSRNLVTVMQAIVSRSLRSEPNKAQPLCDRLRAVCLADDLITRLDEALDIYEVIDLELKPYRGARALTNGPRVKIDGKTARSVAMIIHELTTNAVKHGCFSADAGRLDLTWKVDGEKMKMRWAEDNGGPSQADQKPRRKGFGLSLINDLLRAHGGEITSTYAASGVVHEMTLGLSGMESPKSEPQPAAVHPTPSVI